MMYRAAWFSRRVVQAIALGIALGGALCAGTAFGQGVREAKPSIWDLEPLGRHVAELPYTQFTEFACGTNGGPPSTPLAGWWEYRRCASEGETGLREVFFRYDDEEVYWALANDLNPGVFGGTLVFSYPVLVSALFTDDGFLAGLRIVTDPRTDAEMRRRAATLLNFFVSQFSRLAFACEKLPAADDETPAGAEFIKDRCVGDGEARRVTISANYYRKAGQFAYDPWAQGLTATTGQFWSETRFLELLTSAIPDRAATAARYENWRPEPAAIVVKARNCPGCDFREGAFKRADLRGANLEGANLAGANLHGAILAGANLRYADLSRANLNRADLKRADLTGAKLPEIMAYETHFDGATAVGASFVASSMKRVEFLSANLAGADLTQADMTEARLGSANLTNALLYNTWLYNARMQGTRFSGAELDTVVMYGALLNGADFSAANLVRADLSQADLQGANFTGANLRDALLTGTKLLDARFDGAFVAGAKFPTGFDPGKPAQ